MSKRTSSMIPINPDAIRAYCASADISISELARRIGRTQSYLQSALVRGSLSPSAYPLLVSVAGVPNEEFRMRSSSHGKWRLPRLKSPPRSILSIWPYRMIASVSVSAATGRKSATPTAFGKAMTISR